MIVVKKDWSRMGKRPLYHGAPQARNVESIRRGGRQAWAGHKIVIMPSSKDSYGRYCVSWIAGRRRGDGSSKWPGPIRGCSEANWVTRKDFYTSSRRNEQKDGEPFTSCVF